MLHLVIRVIPLDITYHFRALMLDLAGDLVHVGLVLVENCIASTSARSSQIRLSSLLHIGRLAAEGGVGPSFKIVVGRA